MQLRSGKSSSSVSNGEVLTQTRPAAKSRSLEAAAGPKRPSHREWTTFQPRLDEGYRDKWTWEPGLVIQSCADKKGQKGLFLGKGISIPKGVVVFDILGKETTELTCLPSDYEARDYWEICHNRWIYGTRSFQPHRGVGDSGRAIWFLVNEPGPNQLPNLLFWNRVAISLREIEEGEELLTSYGPAYIRDYPVSRTATMGKLRKHDKFIQKGKEYLRGRSHKS